MSKPPAIAESATDAETVRDQIIAAAGALLAEGGRDAVTTRAVAAAAAVQAPTIYRLFGDKRGLLDAVAERSLAAYVAGKVVRTDQTDPVQDLREGWDMHIAFGLAHPGLFEIISTDPRPHSPSPAAAAGLEVLRRRVKTIALAGRLKISEERAVALMQAAGNGVVLTLLGQPEALRDRGLADVAREAVFAAMITDRPSVEKQGPAAAAIALRAALPATTILSPGERSLLDEWLERLAQSDNQS